MLKLEKKKKLRGNGAAVPFFRVNRAGREKTEKVFDGFTRRRGNRRSLDVKEGVAERRGKRENFERKETRVNTQVECR